MPADYPDREEGVIAVAVSQTDCIPRFWSTKRAADGNFLCLEPQPQQDGTKFSGRMTELLRPVLPPIPDELRQALREQFRKAPKWQRGKRS